MIFTEFSRRASKRGTGALGTDHGTATPMFIIGKGVQGRFYGKHPSLTDLDDGNMKMTDDFRRVYADDDHGVARLRRQRRGVERQL